MHYQVIARVHLSAGSWNYYPYWAPMCDEGTATRLVTYAVQTGFEAVVLQSATAEMLQRIACSIVDRQDAHVLTALRHVPGARGATAARHHEHIVEMKLCSSEELDLYMESADKVELDARRFTLEMGPGNGATHHAGLQLRPISLPFRMDTLQAWMRLRRGLLCGQLGGLMDGAGCDASEDGRTRT